MKHDLAHEEKQNAALREVAAAVTAVAMHVGCHVGKLQERVEKILGPDEAHVEADAIHVTEAPAAPEA